MNIIVSLRWYYIFIANAFFAVAAPTVEGSARLVDGTTLYGGRLEVLYRNKWMTVEVDTFEARRVASLACPSMGFENYNRTPSSYLSPSPEEDAWCILDVECSDGRQLEDHLGECFFHTVSKVCKREEDIGIYCNTVREDVPVGEILVTCILLRTQ